MEPSKAGDTFFLMLGRGNSTDEETMNALDAAEDQQTGHSERVSKIVACAIFFLPYARMSQEAGLIPCDIKLEGYFAIAIRRGIPLEVALNQLVLRGAI